MTMNAILLDDVGKAVYSDDYWRFSFDNLAFARPAEVSIHLAVFVEPYLEYVLEGRKSVESRFSVDRRPPYHRVSAGDVLLLKRAAGPVVGISQVSHVWYYQLDPASFGELRSKFAAALCVQDPAFWAERSDASFATLMRLENVRRIEPIHVNKRDRRGWVILKKRSRQLMLWNE